MLIDGFDPGEAVTARTRLLFQRGEPPEFIECDSMSPEEALLFASGFCAHGVDMTHAVAIEIPYGFYPSKEAMRYGVGQLVQTCKDLLFAARLGGEIAGRIRQPGGRVIEVSAADGRATIGVKMGGARRSGDERKADQQIADLIPRIVRGWPKKSNKHVRDAAVAAIQAEAQIRVSGGVRL